MGKVEKFQIELVKTYKKVFQPVSPNVKKNKKNLELLQSITGFESKSKELKLIKKLIFDDSFNSKLEDHQLYQLLKTNNLLNLDWEKMSNTLREFSHNVKGVSKSVNNKRNLKYFEFITGIESEIIKETFQSKFKKPIVISKQRKIPSISKIAQSYDKDRVKQDKMDLFYEMMRNKQNSLFSTIPKSKQKLLADKSSTRRKKRLGSLERKNRALIKKMTSKLDLIKKKKEKNKIQLTKISHLKDSCSTCSQKVTKKYKKTMMTKLETKIETMEQTEKIIINLKKDTMGDLFRISNESYLPYEDAKEFVKTIELKSKKEWDEYAIKRRKLPLNIPKYPDITYRSTEKNQGWIDWADWLGVKPIKKRSYEETKKYVSKLGLKSSVEWEKYVMSGMLPADIPKYPQYHYKKDWKSWTEFIRNSKSKKDRI